MKFFIAAAAFAGLAAAQNECLSAAVAIPACGLGCITPVAADLGCELTDFACQCRTENVAAIQTSAQECVISACSGIESALMVQSAANAVCSCASSAAAGGGSDSPSSSEATPTGDMESSMTSGGMPTETGSPDGGASSSVSPAAGNTVAVAGSIGGVMGGLLALIAAL